MKNIFKGKVGTAIILVFTVILAGVAIFTAVRLYQLRRQAVAPNVPSSIPQAQEVSPSPVSACLLTFTINSTSTPTPTGTSTATPTPTGTSTATPTPSGTPNYCNGTCGSDSNCQSGMTCYQGYCRNPSCTSQTSCSCPGSSTPTPASLPQSGVNWPTITGAGLGILVILGSLLLVL